jgi:hypothetical protein
MQNILSRNSPETSGPKQCVVHHHDVAFPNSYSDNDIKTVKIHKKTVHAMDQLNKLGEVITDITGPKMH